MECILGNSWENVLEMSENIDILKKSHSSAQLTYLKAARKIFGHCDLRKAFP